MAHKGLYGRRVVETWPQIVPPVTYSSEDHGITLGIEKCGPFDMKRIHRLW